MSLITRIAPGTNLERAVDFLSSITSGGIVAVSSIGPDGQFDGAVFETVGQRHELTAWLQARAGVNLYYSLNEPTAAAAATGRVKLRKTDVAAFRGVAVDLDPIETEETKPGGYDCERTRLTTRAAALANDFFAPPTAIIDSGNGIQLVYLFPEPLPNTDENRAAVEAQAKGLAMEPGADNIQNVDHLLRIPFTTNYPHKKKRDKGRTQRPTRLLYHNPTTTISLENLATVAPPIYETPAASVDLEDFDFREVIAAAEDPSTLPPDLAASAAALRDSRRGATALANPDRSDCDFALACLCVEAGIINPTAVGQIVFSLSPEKLIEKDGTGYGETYAASTIRRALEKTKPVPKADDWFSGDVATDANLPVPIPTFRVVGGVVDAKKIQVRDWLVRPRLPIGDVFQLVGEPGISKSTFMLRDALAVSTGREDILRGADRHGTPIVAERLHRTGSVIVYNAEDRLDEMERRLAASQRHFGVTDAQMKHNIILWSGVDGVALKILERGRDRAPLQRAKGLDLLEELIKIHSAVLVVLDPQVSLASGAVENSNEDADAIMGELARLASRTGVCIAVVHHTAKATRSAAGDMGAGRGAFAAVGKVRSAYTLVRVTGEAADEKAWGVTPADRWIRLDNAKSSHDERPGEPIVFRRLSVAVGNGSGFAPSASGEPSACSPREHLQAEGDRAPVLEVLNHKSRVAAAAAGGEIKDKARAETVARIADELAGDVGKVRLSDVWKPLSERMLDAKVGTAATRGAVTENAVSVLAGVGVAIARGGQLVRIKLAKLTTSPTAPWWIVRVPDAPTGAPQDA